jgi:hypothetical protein
MNHQRRGQGPYAQSGSAGDLVPAVLSRGCFFGARKASPRGGSQALGLRASSLVPPGGCPYSGEQGRRCSRALPGGHAPPLRLPIVPSGYTPTGGTSMVLERWGTKQPEEEPRRQRRSPQHQGAQHRDSCFVNPPVPAPVLATTNMAAAARSKTQRTGWDRTLPHGSGSPQS